MEKIDSNLLFFGNSVDTSIRLGQVENFIDCVDSFFKQEIDWMENEGHPDLEMEFVPLFAEELPPILYTSSIIALISFLEQELKGIASALKIELHLGLSLGHLSGSLLERFHRYIVHVAALEVHLSEREWVDIKAIYEIRNCLVHSGGDLREYPKRKVIEQFSKSYGIRIADDAIELNLDGTKLIASKVSEFIDGIYDGVLERFPGHYEPCKRKKPNTEQVEAGNA